MGSLPIVLPLSNVTFEEAAFALSNEQGFVCIDARGTSPKSGRYSIIAARPSHTFSLAGGFITIDGHTTIDNPYSAFSRFCARTSNFSSDPYLPFSGGILGYIGFEAARALRGLEPASGFSRMPQAKLGIYDTAIVFDHAEGTSFIAANGINEDEAKKNAKWQTEIIANTHVRSGRARAKNPVESVGSFASLRMTPLEHEKNIACLMKPKDSEFAKTADAARSWVRSESLSRIHLVRHSSTPLAKRSALELFFAGPANGNIHAIFMHEGAAYIASSVSGFLRIRGREICSNITAQPKMRSEIVRECARSISELCDEETVVAQENSALEISFTGRLSRELAPIDALVGLMPSHSKTGSPHSQAMEFIRTHESNHRTLYGGAFGIIDADNLSFWTADNVQTIADGMINITKGVDITADG